LSIRFGGAYKKAWSPGRKHSAKKALSGERLPHRGENHG
jgi:hypothetical protein